MRTNSSVFVLLPQHERGAAAEVLAPGSLKGQTPDVGAVGPGREKPASGCQPSVGEEKGICHPRGHASPQGTHAAG